MYWSTSCAINTKITCIWPVFLVDSIREVDEKVDFALEQRQQKLSILLSLSLKF